MYVSKLIYRVQNVCGEPPNLRHMYHEAWMYIEVAIIYVYNNTCRTESALIIYACK